MFVFFVFCEYNYKERKTDYFLYGAAFIMTVFYGLRNECVGSDTLGYISMFYEDSSRSFFDLLNYMWEKKSPGYVFLEWLFFHIIPSARAWLIFTSAFFFFGLSRFIKKHSCDPFFSYFIFFTVFGTFQMTGIRQSLAMVFLMESYSFAIKRNLFKYFIFIIIAYWFHKSSLVFLPVYFLVKRNVRITDFIFITLCIFSMYTIRNSAFDYIKSFTSYYYFEELNHEDPVNYSIMIYTTTLAAFIVCLFLKNKQNNSIKTIKSNLFPQNEISLIEANANLLYIASLFMPMVAVNGAVRRIVMYFSISMVFVIPDLFNKLLSGYIRFSGKILLCAVLLLLLLKGTSSSSYAYSLCFVLF